jgi:hypothetical protein
MGITIRANHTLYPSLHYADLGIQSNVFLLEASVSIDDRFNHLTKRLVILHPKHVKQM